MEPVIEEGEEGEEGGEEEMVKVRVEVAGEDEVEGLLVDLGEAKELAVEVEGVEKVEEHREEEGKRNLKSSCMSAEFECPFLESTSVNTTNLQFLDLKAQLA